MSHQVMHQMFPDLSMSIIESVEKESKNEVELVATLQQLSSTEPSDSAKERLFQELVAQSPDYQDLGRAKVFQILKEHSWNFDLALEDLFRALLDHQKAKNAQEANSILGDIIQGIDQDIIHKIFEKHDGDADAAALELLEKFGHVKQETPQEKKQREQRNIVNAIKARYGITEEEAREALVLSHWAPHDACALIVKKKTKEQPKGKEELHHDIRAIEQIVAAQDPHTLAQFTLAATIRVEGPDSPKELLQALEKTSKPQPVEDGGAPGLAVNSVRLVAPKVVQLGQTFTVALANPDLSTVKTNTNDWIGMYFENHSESSYKTYEWLYHGHQATFKAPTTCCKIFFRYFGDKTYKSTGISEIVHVGPQVNLTHDFTSPLDLQVKIEQITQGDFPNMWVGVFAHNYTSSSKALTWNWMTAAKNGVLEFKLPKAGTYVVRCFPNKTYDHTEQIVVSSKGQDSVQLSFSEKKNIVVQYSLTTLDTNTDRVWIGIYRTTDNEQRNYLRYKNVSTASGTLEMKALDATGDYQARLFTNGYHLVGHSDSVHFESA